MKGCVIRALNARNCVGPSVSRAVLVGDGEEAAPIGCCTALGGQAADNEEGRCNVGGGVTGSGDFGGRFAHNVTGTIRQVSCVRCRRGRRTLPAKRGEVAARVRRLRSRPNRFGLGTHGNHVRTHLVGSVASEIDASERSAVAKTRGPFLSPTAVPPHAAGWPGAAESATRKRYAARHDAESAADPQPAAQTRPTPAR